ncbi:Nuclear transport factor 2 family protein [Sulfidibacter corallicola]|uniref:Nuclear transport factor 2 family protein n=1 Tax=Sulfidibacter corallicola TaxID=2818388 RepID=A0A8A4TSK7_SULCO|nr:nuclear transport factor 2 family protein [Sulfidibacter corallicola]QTD49535.1 nuclear transport factor 2 family protein [Sulfidibacter corallicola]
MNLSKRRAAWIGLALIFTGWSFATAPPTPPENERVINAYIDYLKKFDSQGMLSLMDEGVVYEDPTYGTEIVGKESVTQLLSGMEKVLKQMHIVDQHFYISNSVGVFVATIAVTMNLSPDDPKAEPGLLHATMVFVVRAKDGKITRHTDLANYKSLDAQAEIGKKRRTN